MSCTGIAKYFPHFQSAGQQFCAVPRYFCFGTFCPKVKARSISTGPQPMGFPRKPSEAGCVGRGARKRVQFSPQGGNGIERTLRRRGFGEAPQQAFLQSAGLQKKQVWLHLPCLPLVRTPETPRKNGGSAVSYAPSVSLAFCIPSAVVSMIVNSFSSIVFSILSMCWRQSLSSFCLSG